MTTRSAIATHMVFEELFAGGVFAAFGRLKSLVMVLLLLSDKRARKG